MIYSQVWVGWKPLTGRVEFLGHSWNVKRALKYAKFVPFRWKLNKLIEPARRAMHASVAAGWQAAGIVCILWECRDARHIFSIVSIVNVGTEFRRICADSARRLKLCVYDSTLSRIMSLCVCFWANLRRNANWIRAEWLRKFSSGHL